VDGKFRGKKTIHIITISVTDEVFGRAVSSLPAGHSGFLDGKDLVGEASRIGILQ
jgi:hypothetical protein